LWLAPYVFTGGRVPGVSKPLLAFALVAILSAGLAVFLPILPYKGEVPSGRVVRALATLAIGLTFYFTASVLPATEDQRRASVRAIFVGGAAMLAWSTVQAWAALSGRDQMPLIITQVHHWFSVRDPVIDRVTGMAYEPSWLGNQLTMLYIPLTFASVAVGHSALAGRHRWPWLEAAGLAWCVAILAFTKSRISQVSLLVLVSAAATLLAWKAVSAVGRRMGTASRRGSRFGRMALTAAFLLLLLGLVLGLFLGAGAAAARADPRLWALPSIDDWLDEVRYLYPNDVPFAIGDRLAFAERMVYWTSGFRTFSLFPWLGVGVGNAGFFFEQTMPDYGYRLTEIRALLREPSYGFPNPKNLWVRLLAETGLPGFLLFLIWLTGVGFGAVWLWRRATGLDRMLGLAGTAAILAQTVEGFSLDTFALPQLWLVLGLCTAAIHYRGLGDSVRDPIMAETIPPGTPS
jgi:hypothetical protein